MGELWQPMRQANRANLSPSEVASLSGGASSGSILRHVLQVLLARLEKVERILDVGCGNGDLFRALAPFPAAYVGVDIVRYGRFPTEASARFVFADLNQPVPLPDGTADAVIAVGTIEYLENPRAFVRELVRLARSEGLVIVTTPNQLSVLSKLTLILKNRFSAFTDAAYPSQITALLESDLRHIAAESGLHEVRVEFTDQGRIPWTSRSWPHVLGLRGRAFSDNILISGLKTAR